MNKVIISILALFVLVACGQERTAETVKTELGNVQLQLETLKAQEQKLTAELDSLAGPKKVRAIKVRVKNMQPSHFEHQIEVSGVVDAKKLAFISPEVGGQVKSINVKEGQRIQKGQLIMTLNTRVQQSQLETLKGSYKLAETIYMKQKELWDQKIGSEVQFLEAKNNKESLENQINGIKAQIAMAQIRAPFSGIVDEIHPKIGELASPGQPLVDLVNLNQIEISAEVSEKHLQVINKGDTVTVEFPNYSTANTESKISRKGNIINPANRTFKIVVPLANPQGKLKPNQIATLKLRDYKIDNALVVPSIIVRKDLNGDFLFVVENQNGKNKASKKYVTVGKTFEGNSEIAKGLLIGQEVLIEGYNLVRNGSLIEITQ